MPTYLLHGFRWTRHMIRIHVILQNLDDAAPEWIVAPPTSITILNSFYSMFDFLPPSNPPPAAYNLPPAPSASVVVEDESEGMRMLTMEKGKESEGGKVEAGGGAGAARKSPTSNPRQLETKERPPTFNDWSVVKLLEHYDAEDEDIVSQPYAYVGDYVVEVTLSVSVSEEMAKYEEKMRQEEALIASALEAPSSVAIAQNPESTGAVSPHLSAREVRRKSRRLGWFEKLRDSLEKEAEIGWFVVVCGDEERTSGVEVSVDDISFDGGEEEEEPAELRTPRSAGLRSFFHRKKSGDGK